MKDDGVVAQPLTDAEIEQLDEFLTSEPTPKAAMDISMMDGFITALASGPNMMMPSSMLRWIWDADRGEQSPTFANAAESEHIIELIIRYWNDLNDTLNNALDGYEPLFLESELDGATIPVIDEWCVGYYKCIAIDRAAWAPLMAQHPEWLAVIMLYGTEDGWDELKRRQDGPDQHQAFADSLAGSVRNIHRYWLEQRRMQIARGEIPVSLADANQFATRPRSDVTTPVRAAQAGNTSAATVRSKVSRTPGTKATPVIGHQLRTLRWKLSAIRFTPS